MHYPCRLMSSLRTLVLNDVNVYLPSLACVSRQLEVLDLEGSVLRTGCARGYPSAFLAGWDRLKYLDLTGALMKARPGTVTLPVLEELLLEDCRVSSLVLGEGAGEQLGACAFAEGCPGCKVLTVNVIPDFGEPELDDSISCQGFPLLQRVRMMVDADALHELILEAWPGHLLGPQLPTSVTRMNFDFGRNCAMEQLDLYAALSLAAGYIRVGVPLAEVVCVGCTTFIERWEAADGQDGFVDDDDMVMISNEPDELAYSQSYLPMLRSLRGLTSLDLEKSHCCEKMLGEIVRCMPDLTRLAFEMYDTPEDSQSIKTQPVLCMGLAELRFTHNKCRRAPRRQAVCFELGSAEDLQRCVVLLGGDHGKALTTGYRISFSLDCRGSVTLQPSAASGLLGWSLGFIAGRSEGHSCSSLDAEGCKHAEVIFQWVQGQCSNGSLAGTWQTTVAEETSSTQRLQDQVSA